MAFEEIECLNQTMPLDALPRDGLRFKARKLGSRKAPGEFNRYIAVTIGAGLAAKLHLAGDKSALRLLFGTGDDAGKIGLTVDKAAGRFAVKRQKSGTWGFTINAATAEGLFALEFEPFCVEPEVVAVAGKPSFATAQVTPAMLAAGD